jgi:hypothetical protein
MLKSIWLTPPLAFGRVGASPVPSDAFMWGRDDRMQGKLAELTAALENASRDS